MFLDIQMPGMTGLEVAHQAQGRCHIVFVTAYDAYAVAAFETGALDYVLKPLERERLRLAVDRVRQRMGSNPQNLEAVLRELIKNAEPRKYLRWINASVGSLMQLITVEDVVYFQADAKYTRVVTATCEALIRKPLNELRNELDPAVFWQVHRSTIVNANAIAGVSRDMFGHINLKLKRRDEKLNVSESHAQLFRQM
jgi:DNA-binding LytR/AlgR family response regulator